MAEKNVSELKDLLTKAVKAMEGLADTEEGDSKTERRTDSSSNQSSSSNYKTESQRVRQEEDILDNYSYKVLQQEISQHFLEKKGENRHKEVCLFGGQKSDGCSNRSREKGTFPRRFR